MNAPESSVGGIPEARPVSTQGDHAAYVVHVVSNFSGAPIRLFSPDLDLAVLDRIREPALMGRNDKSRRRRIWSYVERKEVPGLAIVDINLTTEPLMPCRPIRVQFEPVPLDETHPNLVELAKLSGGDQPVVPRSRLLALSRNYLYRTVACIPGIAVALIALFDSMKTGFRSQDLFFYSPLAVFLIALPIGLFWATRWFVVPGGVAVRSPLWRWGLRRPRFYTPSTALLFVAERGVLWTVRICDADRVLETCSMSRLECIALLGAWQSPLPPPEVNKLVDLQ